MYIHFLGKKVVYIHQQYVLLYCMQLNDLTYNIAMVIDLTVADVKLFFFFFFFFFFFLHIQFQG